tara:strand:- start:17 stop:241 length:225 start_codon:yes stop_codon:yes gene_type:complete
MPMAANIPANGRQTSGTVRAYIFTQPATNTQGNFKPTRGTGSVVSLGPTVKAMLAIGDMTLQTVKAHATIQMAL